MSPFMKIYGYKNFKVVGIINMQNVDALLSLNGFNTIYSLETHCMQVKMLRGYGPQTHIIVTGLQSVYRVIFLFYITEIFS